MPRLRPERLEFLGDIITGAVEGGTGYWASVSQYQWVDGERVRVVVGPRVGDAPRAVLHPLDGDGTGLVLTTDVVARGIRLIVDGPDCYLKRTVREASDEDDAGQLDAGDCDCIVQAGLLGEIVYG